MKRWPYAAPPAGVRPGPQHRPAAHPVVYLLQEQNLHATARQLFIHRNTLVYRLQRIRTLLQLDLDDAAVRNVLRTGCILLEYYQGAF